MAGRPAQSLRPPPAAGTNERNSLQSSSPRSGPLQPLDQGVRLPVLPRPLDDLPELVARAQPAPEPFLFGNMMGGLGGGYRGMGWLGSNNMGGKVLQYCYFSSLQFL